MAIDFPNSPSEGEEFTAPNGVTYQWSSGYWSIMATDSSDAFLTNNGTVSSSYTLPAGRNAVSAGPIDVEDGATVTVPSGQSWVII